MCSCLLKATLPTFRLQLAAAGLASLVSHWLHDDKSTKFRKPTDAEFARICRLVE